MNKRDRPSPTWSAHPFRRKSKKASAHLVIHSCVCSTVAYQGLWDVAMLNPEPSLTSWSLSYGQVRY